MNLEEIDDSLIHGVLSHSSTHIVDPDQIELDDLQLAEGVEFPFIVISREKARQFNPNSFEVRVFVRFPTGDLMTLIEERLFINVVDCEINPHVADWCATKTQPQLELLANFIGQYLNIEIEEADQDCVRFKVLGKIVQPKGHSRDSGLTVTKPKQNIHGLFVQTHPA